MSSSCRHSDLLWWQRLSILTPNSATGPSAAKVCSQLGMPLVETSLPLDLLEVTRMVECRRGYRMTRQSRESLPCYLQVC